MYDIFAATPVHHLVDRTFENKYSTITSTTMSDYTSQTVAQLKEILKERNLPVDGKKADLVQRLQENDGPKGELDEDEEEEKQQPTEVAETEEKPAENGEPTEEEPKKEEKPKPKVLTPEERKQLAVDLLTKKIKRAEKFGDEASAETARKDLKRVEKFGVELGTALAKEIGLVDRNLNQGLRTFKPKGKKKNFKKGFKPRK